MASDSVTNRRRWLDRPEMLIGVGYGVLAATFLMVLAPQIGTLLVEIAAGVALVIRGSVLRARSRRTSQLCLRLPEQRARFRMPDRYELTLVIIVILVYVGTSGFLRGRGISEGVIRIIPLAMFGAGLLMRPWMSRFRSDS